MTEGGVNHNMQSRFGFRRIQSSKQGNIPPGPKGTIIKESDSSNIEHVATKIEHKALKKSISVSRIEKTQNNEGIFKSKFGFKPGVFGGRSSEDKNKKRTVKVVADNVDIKVKVATLKNVDDQNLVNQRVNDVNLEKFKSELFDFSTNKRSEEHDTFTDCKTKIKSPIYKIKSPTQRVNSPKQEAGSPRKKISSLPNNSKPSSHKIKGQISATIDENKRGNGRPWKKPSSGPSPYKSIDTRSNKPLVTSLAGGHSKILKPATSNLTRTTNTLKFTSETTNPTTDNSQLTRPQLISNKLETHPTSQLPGLRASFFHTGSEINQRLNSATLHSKPNSICKTTSNAAGHQSYNISQSSSVSVTSSNVSSTKRSAMMTSLVHITDPQPKTISCEISINQLMQIPGHVSCLASMNKISKDPPVQTNNKLKTGLPGSVKLDNCQPQQIDDTDSLTVSDRSSYTSKSSSPRKWAMKQFGELVSKEERMESNSSLKCLEKLKISNEEASDQASNSSLECLAKLRISNKSALDQARSFNNEGAKKRLFYRQNIVTLPAIPQESSIGCEQEMLEQDHREEVCSKSLSSPGDTEEDSGIFTSANSKYSLESLQEPIKVSLGSSIHNPMIKSWPISYGCGSKEIKKSNSCSPESLLTRPHEIVSSKSVTRFSECDELVSRETSPMELLEELLGKKVARTEKREIKKSISPGLVQDRRLRFEESSSNLESNSDIGGEVVTGAKPKIRSFVGLKKGGHASAMSGSNNLDLISSLAALELDLQRMGHQQNKINFQKEVSPSVSDMSEVSSGNSCSGSSLTSVSLLSEPKLRISQSEIMSSVMITSSSSSNFFDKDTKVFNKSSPSSSFFDGANSKEFLIDDDYNDQQELTFLGQEESLSLEESLFEKVDSLLSRRQESQERHLKEHNKEESPNQNIIYEKGISEVDGPTDKESVVCSPMILPKLQKLKEQEPQRLRCESIDTLSGQESIGSDVCMLDFEEDGKVEDSTMEQDKDMEVQMMKEDADEVKAKLSRSCSSSCDEGIILDMSSYQVLTTDMLDVKNMLMKLRKVLQQADTISPFDRLCENDMRQDNLYTNLVLAESDDLRTGAIEKFTEMAEEYSKDRDLVKNVVEENQDLRRQLVFLQQQLEERDRRIRGLEEEMKSCSQDMEKMSSKSAPVISACHINTATQTERVRPLSCGGVRSTNGLNGDTIRSVDPKSSNNHHIVSSPLPLTISRVPSPVVCKQRWIPSINSSSPLSPRIPPYKSVHTSPSTSSRVPYFKSHPSPGLNGSYPATKSPTSPGLNRTNLDLKSPPSPGLNTSYLTTKSSQSPGLNRTYPAAGVPSCAAIRADNSDQGGKFISTRPFLPRLNRSSLSQSSPSQVSINQRSRLLLT